VRQIGCVVGKWGVSKSDMRQGCVGKRRHEEGRREVWRRVTALMDEGRLRDDSDPEVRSSFSVLSPNDATASFDDSDFHRSCAGSSSGEGSPAGRARTSGGFAPQGEPQRSRNRQKFL
jgi:hypothetical protein